MRPKIWKGRAAAGYRPAAARVFLAPAGSDREFCGSAMFDRQYDTTFLRSIFDRTRILRRPVSGIVSGYHVLPYILLGPDVEAERRAVEIRGKIRVSPRLVVPPGFQGQTYGDVFGEATPMDGALVGRLFAFRYATRRNAVVESEDLSVRPVDADPEAVAERILDELGRGEVLDTGVILSPDVKFYPVSVDRFLHDILDREFAD